MIPNLNGSTKISGIRKKTCLVNANKAPFTAFPMAVKKLDKTNSRKWINYISCGISKISYTMTDKNLIHNIVDRTHQGCHNTWNGKVLVLS